MWSRNALRYRTQRLVSVFTRARRLSLSLARLIQSHPPILVSVYLFSGRKTWLVFIH